jgi:hypothetical protein
VTAASIAALSLRQRLLYYFTATFLLLNGGAALLRTHRLNGSHRSPDESLNNTLNKRSSSHIVRRSA